MNEREATRAAKTVAGIGVLARVSDDDMEKLRHMVGATGKNRRRWGCRNHYAPGGDAAEAMERLHAAGLVERGRPYYDVHYYHATEAGCRAVGMGRVTMRRCLEP